MYQISSDLNYMIKNYILDEDQIAEGYILTCVSKPLSDCVVELGQEENLY